MSKTIKNKSITFISLLLSALMITCAIACESAVKANAQTVVKLNHDKIQLILNKTGTLKATASNKDKNGDFIWRSENNNIVTVENRHSKGIIHTKHLGRTIVYCDFGGDMKFSAPDFCKVSVYKVFLETEAGKSKSLKGYVKYVKGYKKAKWSSSKKNIFTVNKNGKFKAKKQTNATITAEIQNHKYRIKIYAYSKSKLKKKAVSTLKKTLYDRKSLNIKKTKFLKYNKIAIDYSAVNSSGNTFSKTFIAYYTFGEFKFYQK